jgi:hypothetical protein
MNCSFPMHSAGPRRVGRRSLEFPQNRQLYELADTFEVLPESMTHWDEATLGRVRSILAEYEASHPQSGYEYLSLLDGGDTAFQANGFNVAAGHEPSE